MGCESADEPLLFLQDQLLEFNQCLELILIKQHAADIHPSPVFILVTPDACRAVVFQGKTQMIDLVVAARAILALAMSSQTLANSEFGQFFLAGLRQGRGIGRRWLGRIIEDHRVDPGSPGNGLGACGGGGHRHDGRTGNDAATARISQRHTLEKLRHNIVTRLGVTRVVRAKHGILPGEFWIQQFHDGPILNVDGLKEEQWLGNHVHAASVSIHQIEVGKLLWIRDRGNQAIELQPLGGEILAKPTRPPII